MEKIFLFLCSVLLLSRHGSCKAEVLLHWLDPDVHQPGYSMSEEQQRQYDSYLKFKDTLDANKDGHITLEELHASKSHLLDGMDKNGFTFDSLKEILTNEPSLMHPEVFADMWWIMTHDLKEHAPDYTMILFNHVDANGDGSWDEQELKNLMVSGCRTNASSTRETKFREMVQTLDADKSGGLSHKELWGLVTTVIKASGGQGIKTSKLAKLFKQILRQPADVLDIDVVAQCLDANKDGEITVDEEINFVPLVDSNFSGEIEEHELTGVEQAMKFCVEKPDKARGEVGGVKLSYPEQKPVRITEL